MAFNREFEINEAQLEDFLKNATDKVRTSENVDLLSDLNKLFKKNVPLTVRKYVIAYLLKEALKHYHPFNNRRDRFERNDRNDRNERNGRNNRQERNNFRQERTERPAETTEAPAATEEERPRHPRVGIPEDQATSIFISIGKNRRVYPRDLVGLLIAVGGIDRERIGDIKVLANYSFVQLYTEDCQTAIDKLNGYDYRGRKLVVSFSKQKDEDASEEKVEAEDSYSNDYTEAYDNEAEEMSAEDAAAYAAAEKATADKEPFGGI